MKCFLLIFTICSAGRLKPNNQHPMQGFSYGSEITDGEENPAGGKDETTEDRAGADFLALSGERTSAEQGAIEDRFGDDSSSSSSSASSKSSSRSSSRSSSESSSAESREDVIMMEPFSAKQTYQGGDNGDKKSEQEKKREKEEQFLQFEKERLNGDPADAIGQNEHVRQVDFYEDLGRRSIPPDFRKTAADNDNYLTPEKAPPELVLLVAKESKLLGPGKDTDLASDIDQKKILRTGDYWNGVWKEEVKPKSAMRSGTQKKNLGSIKAKINEGTELYKVVSKMKEISPKLLYIINKTQL